MNLYIDYGRCDIMKKIFERTKKIVKGVNKRVLMYVLLVSALVGSGIIIINNYRGEEHTLNSDLLSEGTSKLMPSWGKTTWSGTDVITYADSVSEEYGGPSNVMVKFGRNKSGKELVWWIAGRHNSTDADNIVPLYGKEAANAYYMTLYATTPVLPYQVYNSYTTAKNSTFNANNWVGSTIRSYFGRNVGGFPGLYSEKTADTGTDATSGDLSHFEDQYFTNDMLDLISNISRTSAINGGDSTYTHTDKFYIPSYAAQDTNGAVSWAPNELTSRTLTSGNNTNANFLIPPKYLSKYRVWLRSALSDGEKVKTVQKNGDNTTYSITDNPIYEHYGYSPLFTMDISDVAFTSVLRGMSADEFSKFGTETSAEATPEFKEITNSGTGPYYLKFDDSTDLKASPDAFMIANTTLEIPYSSFVTEAYMVVLLTNTETNKSYFTSVTVEKNTNGLAKINVADLPIGKYQAAAWLEYSDGRGREIAVNNAQTKVDKAQIKVDEAQAELDNNTDNSKTDTLNENLEKAQKSLEEAKSSLDSAEKYLEDVKKNVGKAYLGQTSILEKFIFYRGHDVLFTPINGAKFLDQNGNELTDKVTVAIKEGETTNADGKTQDDVSNKKYNTSSVPSGEYKFMVNVDDMHNKSVIKVTVESLSLEKTNQYKYTVGDSKIIAPSKVTSEYPEDGVNEILPGGNYENALKSYWVYSVPIQSDSRVTVTLADDSEELQVNKYNITFGQYKDAPLPVNLENKGVKVEGLEFGNAYEHNGFADFDITLPDGYNASNSLKVKAINAMWLQPETDDDGNPVLLKAPYDGMYNYGVLKDYYSDFYYYDSLQLEDGKYRIKNITTDLVILIVDEIQKEEYNLTFESDNQDINISNALDIEIWVEDAQQTSDSSPEEYKWQPLSLYGPKLKYASEVTFRAKIKNGYKVKKDAELTASIYDSSSADKKKAEAKAEQDGDYYVWTMQDADTTEGNYKLPDSKTIVIENLDAEMFDVTFSQIPSPADQAGATGVKIERNGNLINLNNDGKTLKMEAKDTVAYNSDYIFRVKFTEGYYKSYDDVEAKVYKYEKDNAGNQTKVLVVDTGDTDNENDSSYISKSVHNGIKDSYADFTIRKVDADDTGGIKEDVEIELYVNYGSGKVLEKNIYDVKIAGSVNLKLYSATFKGINTGFELSQDALERNDVEGYSQDTIAHDEVKFYNLQSTGESADKATVTLGSGEAEFKKIKLLSDEEKERLGLKVDKVDYTVRPEMESYFVLHNVKQDSNLTIQMGNEAYVIFSPYDKNANVVLSDALELYIKKDSFTDYQKMEKGLIFPGVQLAVGDSLSFYFKENEKNKEYGIDNIIIRNSDNVIATLDEVATAANGFTTWTFKNVGTNLYLTVDGVTRNAYTIDLPYDSGIEYYLNDSIDPIRVIDGKVSVTGIEHGNSITLKVKAAGGYMFPENAETKIFSSSSNISATMTQNSTKNEQNVVTYYTVDFKNITGKIDNLELLAASKPILSTLNVTFSVPVQDNIPLISVLQHGNRPPISDGELIGSEIAAGYLTDTNYGGTISFRLKGSEGYSIEGVTVSINHGNGKQTVIPSTMDEKGNLYYTTPEITEESVITVSEGKYNSYKVRFEMEDTSINMSDAISIYEISKETEGDNTTYKETKEISTAGTEVVHGKQLIFRMDAKGKYNKSHPIAGIKTTNDNTLKILNQEVNNSITYFVSDTITEETVITISQIKLNDYSVMFEGENLSFYSDSNHGTKIEDVMVQHESSYQFYVSADTGYDVQSVKFDIKLNSSTGGESSDDTASADAQIKVDDAQAGKYTVTNVTDDIIITASVERQKYTINFAEVGDLAYNGETKFEVSKVIDDVETPIEDNKILLTSGEELEFVVKLNEKYNKSQILTNLNDSQSGYLSEITKTEDSNNNKFRYILNAVNDTIVQISGLSVNDYSITLPVDNQTLDIYDSTTNSIIGSDAKISVKHGESYSFRTKARESYDITTSVVGYKSASDTENDNLSEDQILSPTESGEYYRYTISEVNGDTRIIINPLDKMQYNLNLDGSNVTYYNADGDEVADANFKVEHGSNFTFRISANDGYNLDSVSVNASNGLVVSGEDLEVNGDEKPVKQFTVYDVTSDTTIVISKVNLNEYDVKFKMDGEQDSSSISKYVKLFDASGNDITSGGKSTHSYNFNFSFELQDPYVQSADGLGIKVEGTDDQGNLNGLKYVVEKVDNTFTLKVNNSSNDGVGVQGDLTLILTGIQKNRYNINFAGEGAIITSIPSDNTEAVELFGYQDNQYVNKGNATINHWIDQSSDEQYTIRLYADTERGFKLDQDIDVYATSGKVEKGESGSDTRGDYYSYTIKEVYQDTTVNLEGLKSKYYKVTFNGNFDTEYQKGIGYSITNEQGNDITSGVYLGFEDKITFKLSAKEGYTQSEMVASVTPKDGTSLISNGNGEYTLTQGSSSTVINITGIKVNSYQITFNDDNSDKISFYDSQGNSKIDSGIIQHNVNQAEKDNTFTFRIRPENGYNMNGAKVSVANAEVTTSLDSNGDLIVTLRNVTSMTVVIVSDIQFNLYPVTFKNDSGEKPEAEIIEFGTGRDISETGTQAYFGKTVQFKVILNEGYTRSEISVVDSDGKTLTPSTIENADGALYYTIDSVQKDMEITIKGIKKNVYRLNITANDEETINNSSFYEGANQTDTEVQIGNKTIEVEHGSSYSFRVKPNAGHTAQDVNAIAYDADVDLSYDSSNGWMVVNLSDLVSPYNKETNLNEEIIDVKVSGIKKNKYTVRFEGVENVRVFDDTDGILRDITTSGKEVAYGSDLSFRLSPNEGYDRVFNIVDGQERKVTAWHGETELGYYKENTATSYADGHFTVKHVSDETVITIKGVELNTYKLSFAGNHVTFRNSVTGMAIPNNSSSVQHGGYYKFKITPNEGYDLSEIGIETTNGELTEDFKSDTSATYTLNNVNDDATINVRINASKVELSFEEGEGFVYQNSDASSNISGIQTIVYGETYKFAVRALPGYDINTLKVNQGDTTLIGGTAVLDDNGDYIVFTTNELKADTKISATISKKKYSIRFQEIDGVTYYENGVKVDNNSAIMEEYGNRFQFTIKLDGKHDQSTISVRAVGTDSDSDTNISLAPINGIYTLTDISENMKIEVDGVEVNKYRINLAGSTGIQYNSGDGKKENIGGMHVVEYNGVFSFKVVPLEGYETSNMVVTVKGADGTMKSLTPSSGGVYTLSNIKEDKTVSVQDAAQIQYTVKLAPVTGITYKNDSDVIISDSVKITHGNSFEFTISLDDAYDESIPVVTSTGKTGVTKLETGKYMISNITEDLTINISNVIKNTYTVNLGKTDGAYYQDMSGRTISGDQIVGYNEDFSFKVGLQTAYTDSEIVVMLGSDPIVQEDDGSYKITGILENKTVTITNVYENIEVDLIHTINLLKDDVENAEDVNLIVQATQTYNQLSEEKQGKVTNIDKLEKLQGLAGEYNHTANGINVSGDNLDWYIKLVALPLSSSTEEHERIYDQLNSEFILSLYDIYLWDMMSNKKYELPKGEKVIVTIPTPDLKYFANPFIIHEKSSDGKLEYLVMSDNGDTTSFEMTSFSPVGMAATKVLGTGYSSFYEGFRDGMDNIENGIYEILQTGVSKNKGDKNSTSIKDPSITINRPNSGKGTITSGNSSSSSEEFAQVNETTNKGSALRLLMIIIFGVTISGIVTILVKRKDNNNMN